MSNPESPIEIPEDAEQVKALAKKLEAKFAKDDAAFREMLGFADKQGPKGLIPTLRKAIQYVITNHGPGALAGMTTP